MNPEEVELNMVHWRVEDNSFDHVSFRNFMIEEKIKIKPFDEDTQDYRLVVYSGIRESEIEKVVLSIRAYFAIF